MNRKSKKRKILRKEYSNEKNNNSFCINYMYFPDYQHCSGRSTSIRIGKDETGSPGAIKTDTGDPSSPREGQLTINTADNAIKIYADGAWRTLVSW